MIITDHTFKVPLDYDKKNGQTISIFTREIVNEGIIDQNLPYLIFFQGGPGYESPRPITCKGWLKKALESYRVILLDQRGTGSSSPVDIKNLINMDDEQLAHYLTFFRADNIIKDAEFIRQNLIKHRRWSLLGQSFGGFCALHYLSSFPDSLEKVFITGGIPPLDAHPDDIYRATFNKVIYRNETFYKLYPQAKKNIKEIVDYINSNQVFLPNGDRLSIKRLQQLGLNLGFSDGMPTLNYLFERGVIGKHLSYPFLKSILSMQTFDTNPIFTILHEACYAQGFSTNWSAQRILKEFPIFSENNEDLYLLGEMLFPWMLDDYQELKPFKNAANILAKKKNWPRLYDPNVLAKNKVPIKAAVYTNDMYVDRNFSIDSAGKIQNIDIWESDIYEHNALRSDGGKILDILFQL